MKTTRRIFLGGIAAASVPVGIVLAAGVVETQEEKCIRLTKELLAEFSMLPFHGESLGGPFLDLRNGTDINCLRYARKEDGQSALIVMIDAGEAMS